MSTARSEMIAIGVLLFCGVTGAPVAAQANAEPCPYVKAQATRENDQIVWHVQMLDSHGDVKEEFAHPLAPDQKPAELREEFTTEYLPALPFDIDFAGGSGEAFLQHLRERLLNAYAGTPTDLHPLLPEEPLRIDIELPTRATLQFPAVKAKAVSMEDLADRIVPDIGDETGISLQFECLTQDDAELDELRAPPSPHRWRLSLEDEGISREVAAYGLSKLVGKMTANDVVSAFEAGWKMTGNVIAVSVKVHEPTQTLILCASEAEIAIADEIYAALSGESRTRSAGTLEDLLRELRDLRQELRTVKPAKDKNVQ